MRASRFGGFHQLPTLLQRYGGGDFDKGVFSGLHRGHGHGGVVFPGGGDDHSIDIIAFQNALPGVAWLAHGEWRFAACLADLCGYAFEGRGVRIG